jgi:hypothetical protein
MPTPLVHYNLAEMKFILATFACLIFFAALARAEEPAFPKGTWTLQTYGSYAAGKRFYDEKLASGALGFGYAIFDNVSLNAELFATHITQSGPDANALNLQILLRHHLLQFDRFTVFADVGPGIFEGSEKVPEGGTSFNITFRSGVGATYRLRENLYLLGGARYFHLSNAALEGREHNPSINGIEGYFGIMWRF